MDMKIFFQNLQHPYRGPLFEFTSISNGFVSTRIYEKHDDFDFDIVNFPFLDGNVPCRPSYGGYISQLKHFASR